MQITDTQQFDVTVSPLDSKGNPTSDTLTWTTSSTNGTTVVVDDATTLKVTVVAGGPEDGITLTGTDENGLAGSVSFGVGSGKAVTLSLNESEPVEQPTATEPPADGSEPTDGTPVGDGAETPAQ